MIQKTNLFSEIDENLLAKRKFVIIPSISTFVNHHLYLYNGTLLNSYLTIVADHWELIKNFCSLFPELSFDQADFHLGKANYNLALAVENYHYELC